MGILHAGPTAFLDELFVHVGELDGGLTPHPPHRHEHEELQVALCDHIRHVAREDDTGEEEDRLLPWGSFVFTDSNLAHTFRNAGAEPGRYLHLRWRKATPDAGARSGLRVVHEGREDVEIYSGPSRYLSRITLKSFTLPAGGVVPKHRHDHEVAFVLVDGAAEVLGKRIEAPAFAFMKPGMPHGFRNPESATAWLYAVEFHPPS
jgi:quercetin dioxygenase-like cupin family protein